MILLPLGRAIPSIRPYTDAGRASTEAEVRATILGHALEEWLPDLSTAAPDDADYWNGPWSTYSWATQCVLCDAIAAIDVNDEDFDGPIGRAVEDPCPEAYAWRV